MNCTTGKVNTFRHWSLSGCCLLALLASVVQIGCGVDRSPTTVETMTESVGQVNSRPNILFVLVDDLGWADIGVNGSQFYETPHINKLARAGMRFDNAYASSPVCSPTRAALLTGRNPARLHITDWIPGFQAGPNANPNKPLLGPAIHNQLPLSEVTLAEVLKAEGYRTMFAGKWHLGGEGFLPQDQGFSINKGGHHKGQPPGGYYSPYNNPQLSDGPDGEYLTDRLTDETIRFIEGNRQQPFFAYLSLYTVHTPIQAAKRHLDKFTSKAAALQPLLGSAYRREGAANTKLRQDNPAYASMVHAMDENVGRLLAKLDELGLSDNTIVVFTSDNGGLSTYLGDKLKPTSNEPLRAGKAWLYEGGIRVPLIMHVPGTTRPGRVSSQPVTSTDLFPTLLELAGITVPGNITLDGLSLAPVLGDATHELDRQALYWHYPHYHGVTWSPGAAIRVDDWKLIEFYEEQRVELYNLADDISEKHDRAEAMPEKTAQLRAMLRKWQQSIDAKMPVPNPEYRSP